MSRAVGLDHVGIVGRDLTALASAFERLGFTLTPLARHAGGRTGNRCVMLNGSYLELLSTIDGGTSATLDRFLARYEGVHIIALRTPDLEAARARLVRAGIEAPAPNATERKIDDSDPASPVARFELVSPPDLPEARAHLVRHLTPGVLWQDRFLHHANQMTGLVGITVESAEPAATAARLSVLAGVPVVPDPSGGYALPLGEARIRIAPATGHSVLPCITTLDMTAADGGQSAAARAEAAGHKVQSTPHGIAIQILNELTLRIAR